MSVYSIIDPWFSDSYLNGRSISVLFDTGNESNSYITCSRFPMLERIQIPVSDDTIEYFNTHLSSKYALDTIERGVTMKSLYLDLKDRVSTIDMENMGYKYIETPLGHKSVINLEVVDIKIDVRGLRDPLITRVYCSSLDSDFDILFSMKYITSLLSRYIIVSPTSQTAHLYQEIESLESKIRDLSRDISYLNTASIPMLMDMNKRLSEIRTTRFPVKLVTLS